VPVADEPADLPAEKTVAFAPAPSLDSEPPPELPELPPEKTMALGAEPAELPAEKTMAWDETSGVVAPPRRRSGGLAGPSQAGIRLGPEADRFFQHGTGTPSDVASSPPTHVPSAPAGPPTPFDPFGGAPAVSAEPGFQPPPSADPFVARVPVPVPESLGKPQPRRWLLAALLGGLVVLLLVGGVAALVALRHKPTTLEIISVPEGAAVELDGRAVSSTPVTIPDVQPGQTYRLQLRRPGYEPRQAELRVVEGPNRSVFLLNQIRVTLRIETQPAGAQVWVDNVLRGSAPLDIPGLAAGQRVLLRSSAPGHEVVSREITLAEDERSPRVLLELPASAPP
jgi:hypothetical protein